MSASGQEPTPTRNARQEADSGTSTTGKSADKDIIPIPLIIGIFVVVLGVTAWLLHDNWTEDMTRYRSIRAQQKGNYEAAVKHLNRLIEIAKETGDEEQLKNPTYYAELGNSYMKMEDYENALKYYLLAQQNRANMGVDEQGNRRPPADFNNRLGFIYMKMGNTTAAQEALTAAVARDKVDSLANFTLGEMAMQQGEYIRAADYFKVVASHPAYENRVKQYYDEIEEKLFAGI